MFSFLVSFLVYANRSLALIFFPLLLPFTLSPFSGHGFRLQQASCTDRHSRGLLENTVQEQKCKQVERSFVALYSFPCHNTLTLNIPLSSSCMVCCGGFCGAKLPKSTLLCIRSLLTISRARRDASHPFSVLGKLQADGGLLWIYDILFLAPSIHGASKFTLAYT